MKRELISILTDLVIRGKLMDTCVFLQGTLSPESKYPDTFITFFTDDTEDRSFYSNEVTSIDWTFSVIIYSNDPYDVYDGAEIITNALRAEGFIPQGKGRDIPSDVPTHTGWAMEFIKTEYLDY